MATLLDWVAGQAQTLIKHHDQAILGLGDGWSDETEEEERTRELWAICAKQNHLFNTTECLFLQLPEEVQLLILSHLDIKTLALAGLCSRTINRLVNDEFIWRSLFNARMGEWKAFIGGSPFPSLGTERGAHHQLLRDLGGWFEKKLAELEDLDTSETENEMEDGRKCDALTRTWKQLVIQQVQENRKSIQPPSARNNTLIDLDSNEEVNARFSATTSSWLPFKLGAMGNIFNKKVPKIVTFGEGPEHSAKQLLYDMMWGQDSCKMTKLYPGVEGIGSGVGFSVEGIELNLTVMHRYRKRGVFETLRPLWKDFFESASGFIFVIDNIDDEKFLRKKRKMLETFLSPDPDLGIDTTRIASAPLLVLLCKLREDGKSRQESKREKWQQSRGKLNPAALAQHLGLMDNMHGRISRWCVRSVNVETMSGLAEGLHWLAQNL